MNNKEIVRKKSLRGHILELKYEDYFVYFDTITEETIRLPTYEDNDEGSKEPLYSPIPEELIISVSDYCTQDCEECRNLSGKYNNTFLSYNFFKNNSKFNLLLDYTLKVRIIGGEPLLHPEIVDILLYLKSKNVFLTLETCLPKNNKNLLTKEQLNALEIVDRVIINYNVNDFENLVSTTRLLNNISKKNNMYNKVIWKVTLHKENLKEVIGLLIGIDHPVSDLDENELPRNILIDTIKIPCGTKQPLSKNDEYSYILFAIILQVTYREMQNMDLDINTLTDQNKVPAQLKNFMDTVYDILLDRYKINKKNLHPLLGRIIYSKCLTPIIIKHMQNSLKTIYTPYNNLNYCDAGRFSLFIDEQGIARVCEFGDIKYFKNIKTTFNLIKNKRGNILKFWSKLNNKIINYIRTNKKIKGCSWCNLKDFCLGECLLGKVKCL